MSNKIINGADWIDISVPVSEQMAVFAYEQKPRFERRAAMERGDMGNNSTIHMGIHTGTHLDAPRHGIIDGKTIDKMPLSEAIGPARVIEINDSEAVKAQELSRYQFKRGERVLFKTINSARCWKTDEFVPDFVYIAPDAAQILADSGVKLVGIDYLSVGGPPETHKIFLGAGIWLLEGLDLSAAKAGNYNLLCLPLKLIGVEGSPVRAAIQPLF
jgi:arylformamidase